MPLSDGAPTRCGGSPSVLLSPINKLVFCPNEVADVGPPHVYGSTRPRCACNTEFLRPATTPKATADRMADTDRASRMG